MPQALLIFLRITLVTHGLLWFHTNFMIICSIPIRNAIGVLIEIALNLFIALGNMEIVTVLIFPTHKHSIIFHLFVSCMDVSIMATILSPYSFSYLSTDAIQDCTVQ